MAELSTSDGPAIDERHHHRRENASGSSPARSSRSFSRPWDVALFYRQGGPKLWLKRQRIAM
jgi:hypothetical protein